MINWLSAVLVLLGIYGLAGVVQSAIRYSGDQASDNVTFWGTMMLVSWIAAVANEWRVRRFGKAKRDSSAESDGS